MQSNQQFLPRNSQFPPSDDFFNAPSGSFFQPFHGFEVQPSEACPKNFIIFDQTDNRSKIMYHHPTVRSNLSNTGLNFGAFPYQNTLENNHLYSEERENSSYVKEDSEDIDVLMSLEEEEEDFEDEEVSTARTDTANYGNKSPDSCSNYGARAKKCRQSSLKKSTASMGSCSGKKREKTRKMMKALRGIIPGAGRMNSVNVLDEAVRYLKSLKVEVQKLGIGTKKSYI